MFDLTLGPLEMAFLGILPDWSADETVRKAARLIEAEGDASPAAWLRLCGLDAEAAALLSTSEHTLPVARSTPGTG